MKIHTLYSFSFVKMTVAGRLTMPFFGFRMLDSIIFRTSGEAGSCPKSTRGYQMAHNRAIRSSTEVIRDHVVVHEGCARGNFVEQQQIRTQLNI